MRLCVWVAAAPHDVARYARHCGAAGRTHPDRHQPPAPPPAEQPGPAVHPSRQLQQPKIEAFARLCLPLRRAARSAQAGAEHDGTPPGAPPTERRRRLAPPPAEQPGPAVQPPHQLQQLRKKAFARVCLPMRRAARARTQVDAEHDGTPPEAPPTERRRRRPAAPQQQHQQPLQQGTASAFAPASKEGRVDAPSRGPSYRRRGAAAARTPCAPRTARPRLSSTRRAAQASERRRPWRPV